MKASEKKVARRTSGAGDVIVVLGETGEVGASGGGWQPRLRGWCISVEGPGQVWRNGG